MDIEESRNFPLIGSVVVGILAIIISVYLKNPSMGVAIGFIALVFGVGWFLVYPACVYPEKEQEKKE